MKKIMFVFNSDTLRHLLEQLKVQIDKKIDNEQYAIKAEATDADALIVGTDIAIDNPLIVDLINIKGVAIANGDKVLIKDKVLSEVNYTQDEKNALKEIIDGGGLEAILDSRLDGLNLEVVSQEEYDAILDSEAGLERNKLYIVTDKEFTALEIENYLTKDELQAVSDLKVDKVTYINQAEETVEKVLSQKDFTEAHAAIVDFIIENGGVNGLVLQSEIVDNLESEDASKALSANQGKIIKDEYLAGKKHAYVTQAEYDAIETKDENTIYHIKDAETLYGLTEEQMMHLKHAYEHSLVDYSQTYASKSEVYQSRRSLDGRFYKTLQERLFALDQTADELFYNLNNFENINESLNIYGVHVDFEEQEIIRLGCAQGKQGGDDFNTCYPWAGMRRCNVLNGEVVAYENDTTYVEDGSNGDVMVEIPKFYYKVIPVRTEPAASGEGLQLVEAQWYISPNELPSFKVHPAFVRNGEELNHIYAGAYVGSIFDVSANKYLYNNETDIDYNVDGLCSIAGTKPFSSKTDNTNNATLNSLLHLASNRNEYYTLYDFTTHSALQLLFLIEYGSFDSQENLGQGPTYVDSVGQGEYPVNTNEEIPIYRGIKGIYGHGHITLAKCSADSLGYFYWSNEEDDYKSLERNVTKFKLITRTTSVKAGFINRFGYDDFTDFAFLPTDCKGSSSIFPHDFYYAARTNLDWNHPRIAGIIQGDGYQGLYSYDFDQGFSNYATFCGRLLFYK